MEDLQEGNLNLEEFLNDFQSWKQDVDLVIQQNVELQESLKEEKRQFKQKQELDYIKAQETNYLHATVKDLQQAIEHLQGVEDANQKLHVDLEKITNKNKQEKQVHFTEVQKLQTRLEECRMQSEQQLQDQRTTLNYEMKNKEDKFLAMLSEKDNNISDLEQEISRIKQTFKEESFKMQAQHRLQVIKLEERASKYQHQSAATQSVADREIYRNKLQRLQEQYHQQLELHKQEIQLLKEQLLAENSTNGSTLQNSEFGKLVPRFNKKRKLYRPIETLLQPNED